MEEIKYTLKQIINNTAYIEFENGKTTLLNIENDQIIGDIGMYKVITNQEKQLFIQVKSEGSKRIVNIYDASKGEFVIFGWELMLQIEDDYSRMAVKSPIDGKIQLFDCSRNYITYQTGEQSDRDDNNQIEQLNNDYYIIHKKNVCDIVQISQDKKITIKVENCKIIEKKNDYLIYCKDGKYGAFPFDICQEPSIPPIYDSISTVNRGTPITFASLKQGNDYFLARIYNDQDQTKRTILNRSPYKRIDFLQDIMVLNSSYHISIYDYNWNLLQEYSKDIEIKELKNAENKYLYCIDGSFYVYNAIEKKLKEVHTREVRVYTTIYETDTHFYTLRGYDKESCKSFCERIESLPEEEAKRILNQMSDPKILQRDYPTLSLVKQKKL